MMATKPPVFLILVMVLEAGAAAYLGFVAWLIAVWMVDDAVAAQMHGVDWYVEAVRRGAIAAAIAVAFGALVMAANRRWLAPRAPQWAAGLRRISIILGAGIAGAAAAGAIEFAWKKPFM